MTEQQLIQYEAENGDDEMRGAVAALAAEVRRLRGLIQQAESYGGLHATDCPWCGMHIDNHDLDCPAFSAPGVVR